MIISLALIAAVAIFNVSPWALALLVVTWIPDAIFMFIVGGDTK